jgi:hypothetical protein
MYSLADAKGCLSRWLSSRWPQTIISRLAVSLRFLFSHDWPDLELMASTGWINLFNYSFLETRHPFFSIGSNQLSQSGLSPKNFLIKRCCQIFENFILDFLKKSFLMKPCNWGQTWTYEILSKKLVLLKTQSPLSNGHHLVAKTTKIDFVKILCEIETIFSLATSYQ